MPVTFRAADVKYKNSQGQYQGINSVSEATTAEQVAAVNAAGAAQVQNVESAGQAAASSATAAAASESAAAASATAASNSATNAQGSASNAASSATAASASATAAGNAQTAAETAQGKAEDAQEAAEQAQSDAETAAQSVSQSAAQIETNRQDISDLKSAVNKLTPAATDADVGKALIVKTVDPTTGKPSAYEYGEAGGGGAPAIYDTASGAIASFDDGADGMPLKSLTVNVEPVQSGSGDPSPTNVRPISGWTGANVVVSPTTDAQDGTIYPISWQSEAGTVYGGTLDVDSGVLTVTKAEVDLGTLNWTLVNIETRSNFFNATLPTKVLNGNYISSMYYKTGNPYSFDENLIVYIINIGGNGNLFIRNTAYTTAADFKAAMSGVQLVYELATPIEITLTPTKIDTLLGTNNIWADAGPVSVDYPADTKLYIQKINVPTDDDMTADTQIASGKYFIIGNNLYLSTTTIPAGDTIIPGTNCTQTNLAEALNALNT